MKNNLIFGGLILVTILFANILYSQQNSVKLNFIDAETILKEFPEFQEIDKKVREIGQKWSDTLQIFRADLNKKLDAYQKQSSKMTADQKQIEVESLQTLKIQIMQFQEEKFGLNGELDKMRMKLLEPISEKIKMNYFLQMD